jgi:hypothetical protein
MKAHRDEIPPQAEKGLGKNDFAFEKWKNGCNIAFEKCNIG